ncbi:MAG: SlyX family protein [Alphaproteobacteria bacterium]|nr:SlyX family protein [Alphaproteobacteria bacterium]
MKTIEDRLMDLEIYLANHEKMLDELNDEILRQSKLIDTLLRQNQILMNAMKESVVKPQSEETKPPHY